MMKSCKILNVARLLALALVAVLLIPACLPVAHAATATKLALLMEAEKYQYIQVQPAINPQPTFNTINNVEQPQVPNNLNTSIPLPETHEQAVPVQPNVKVKKLKGNVLVIPIVIIWLGLVLVGTIKLVTSILT